MVFVSRGDGCGREGGREGRKGKDGTTESTNGVAEAKDRQMESTIAASKGGGGVREWDERRETKKFHSK